MSQNLAPNPNAMVSIRNLHKSYGELQVLKGVDLDVLWPEVVPLAIFGLVVFAASALRFRKTLG